MQAVILMLRMQMTGLIYLARIAWHCGYTATLILRLTITKLEHGSFVTQGDTLANAQASTRI